MLETNRVKTTMSVTRRHCRGRIIRPRRRFLNAMGIGESLTVAPAEIVEAVCDITTNAGRVIAPNVIGPMKILPTKPVSIFV
jgi:hypothetical protein